MAKKVWIEPEFDSWLKRMQKTFTEVLKRSDISMADTQRIIARANNGGFIIINNIKKRRKRLDIEDLL